MNKIKKSMSMPDLHLAGRFLCFALIILPISRVFLYPNTEGSWQYFSFNGLVSFLEILFISIFILTRRARNYHFGHLPNILWLAFIIWAIVALHSLPNMPNPADGMTITAQFFIHFAFGVTLSSYLKSQPSAGRILVCSVILSALLFLPAFWLKLYTTYDQPGFDWVWSLPGFQNVRHLDYFLGSILTILGLFPVTNISKDRPRTHIILHFILLLAFWVMLFWSGGRGSAIAAVAAIGAVLLFFKPRMWRQIAAVNLAALALGAIISLLLPIPDPSYGLFRFYAKMTESISDFGAGRLEIWLEALKVWKAHLWLGIGAGQTKTIIKTALGSLAQPHNVFIQALMAWGLIGGIPFLGGIFSMFWGRGKDFIRSPEKRNTFDLAAYGLALSIAINATVDGTLYYPFPLFLFIIAASVAYSNYHKS